MNLNAIDPLHQQVFIDLSTYTNSSISSERTDQIMNLTDYDNFIDFIQAIYQKFLLQHHDQNSYNRQWFLVDITGGKHNRILENYFSNWKLINNVTGNVIQDDSKTTLEEAGVYPRSILKVERLNP